MRRIAVLDIGKTNAKVLVADLGSGAEEVLARTPNAVMRDGPYPHHDLKRLWDFALSGLRLAAGRGVDAVQVTDPCTIPMRDSSRESSVVAGWHEQTRIPRLQDQELARL